MRVGDAPEVLAIYEAGIATGHATFEHVAPSWADFDRTRLERPRLVAVDEGGAVVGWAAVQPVSTRPVYAGVGEVGLYVAPGWRGRSIGRALLERLIEEARRAGLWTLQAGIFPENAASLALHRTCGFRIVGRRERIGRMVPRADDGFRTGSGVMAGHWRDVLLLERRLEEEKVVTDRAVEMRTEVRALLFDVFGTLVDWRASIARAVEAADLEVDADAFARAWRARYQPAMQRIRSGERGFVTLDRLHRENLVETLAAFGVEGLDEAAIDRLTFAWHRLDPWEDAVPGLTRLKSRYVVAPCSNGNVALMVDLARHAGLVWDAVLGAEPAGAYKPSPQAYLRSVAMLGLEPARCMMVAAHNDDLAAAAALGLKTAFFPRPEEHGIEAGRDLGPTGPWTFVARDLVDLAERLGC